jgi:hypothetical protein
MKRGLFFLPVLFFANSALAAVPSHCFTGEQIFFTCRLADERVISLCGAAELGKDIGYMQFRAGPEGNIEYEFPHADQKSPAKVNFTNSHYFRYRTDYRRIIFTDEDTEYQVFADYNGEDGEDLYEAGLVFGGWDGAVTPCKKPYLDNLAPLDDVLPEEKDQ